MCRHWSVSECWVEGYVDRRLGGVWRGVWGDSGGENQGWLMGAVLVGGPSIPSELLFFEDFSVDSADST